MMTRLLKYLWLLAIIMPACNPAIKPIDYGNEKCSHCRMSVVDQRFACQLVTTKGKSFSFDAVECMIQFVSTQVEEESTIAILATNTLDKPGVLSDAKAMVYLVSENMPSPMGAYINPFYNNAAALENQQKNGGDIYTWHQLTEQFKGHSSH
jgi:copper chaperone NosL